MGKLSSVVLVIIASILITACTGKVSSTDPLQCGKEDEHEGFNTNARECLWQAFNKRNAAEFISTAYTDEGDPITQTVKILASGSIRVIRDASKDKFGEQEIVTYSCQSIQQEKSNRFTIVGCTGGEANQLSI